MEPLSGAAEKELIAQRLLAPFSPEELEVRPGPTKFGKAQPLFYVDSRVIESRLRAIFGIGGFSTNVTNLTSTEDFKPSKTYDNDTKEWKVTGENHGLLVSCSVSIRIHHPLLSCEVSNVGEKGLDDSSDTKTTSAFAQGFKRAAAQLGLGAYLYYIAEPPQPYDHTKKFGNYKLPSDTVMNAALKMVGFKFKCEETGEEVPWLLAAKTMSTYGRVLGKTFLLSQKEAKPQPEEEDPFATPSETGKKVEKAAKK